MQFRRLPPFGGTPRDTAEIVNNIMNGKTNNTGYVTLATGGALTTTLYDERISPDSKIVLIPASAAAFADSAPYGMFSDSTDQTAVATGTEYLVTFNTTEFTNGVTLSNSSRLNAANAGIYDVQFSVQFKNTTNDSQYADVWLKVNGTDLANSASRFGLSARKSTGDPAHTIGAINAFVNLTAGQYVELAWAVSDTGVSIESYAADSVRPAIPGVIVTMNYVAPLAYSDIYVSAQSYGSATISHWSNSTADKRYAYIIVG